MKTVEISALYYYPVKSLAGIFLQHAKCDALGILNDRRWMLVDPKGRFITQRQCPHMSLIQTDFVAGELRLSQHSYGSIAVANDSAETTTDTMQVKIWKSEVKAHRCDSKVDAWLSEVLSTPCHLVYFSDQSERQVDTQYAQPGDQVAFADGFPLLITTEESLRALNDCLDKPVDMLRFRPNVVVKGSNAAFAEHQWQSLKIGAASLNLVKPCSRCVMTTVDYRKGKRDGIEPYATLKQMNLIEDKPCFGVNAIGYSELNLNIGDQLEIVSLEEA